MTENSIAQFAELIERFGASVTFGLILSFAFTMIVIAFTLKQRAGLVKTQIDAAQVKSESKAQDTINTIAQRFIEKTAQLHQKVDELNQARQSDIAQIAALRAQIETYQETTDTLNDELRIINAERKENQSEIARLKLRISALEAQLSSEYSAKNNLLTENAALRKQVQELEARVSALEDENRKLKETLEKEKSND